MTQQGQGVLLLDDEVAGGDARQEPHAETVGERAIERFLRDLARGQDFALERGSVNLGAQGRLDAGPIGDSQPVEHRRPLKQFRQQD